MKNIEEIMGILFKRVSPFEVLSGNIEYNNLQENSFVNLITPYLKQFNGNEIHNLYHYVADRIDKYNKEVLFLNNSSVNNIDVFDILFFYVRNILITCNNQIEVPYYRLLEWRKTINDVHEDTLVCAYEALYEIWDNCDFSWESTLETNNFRLKTILNKGYCENHFHLWASGQYFQLFWVKLMNNSNQSYYMTVLNDIDKNRHDVNYKYELNYNEESFQIMYLQAALIRAYLYAWLTNTVFEINDYEINDYIVDANIVKKYNLSVKGEQVKLQDYRGCIPEKEYAQLSNNFTLEFIIKLLKDSSLLTIYKSDILHAIKSLRINGTCIFEDDYVSPANNIQGSRRKRNQQILYSEKNFLYRMFCKIHTAPDGFNVRFNLFYAYLLIKEKFRSELVQINNRSGFYNFDLYSRRKNQIIVTNDEWSILADMALKSTLQDKNLKMLEARITPSDTYDGDFQQIKQLDAHLTEEEKKRTYYVFHFIKETDPETGYGIYCRHYLKRKKIENQAYALAKFREMHPKIAERVRGIDACSSEIGCRPEVFAQSFIFLRNHVTKERNENGELIVPQLRVTFHVGEDFLDIIDGLRAIDEAIHFLELNCGDRLGHAIALGIDADRWYQVKNYQIVLPMQDYLDNVVWMYAKLTENNIPDFEGFLHFLENEFQFYFEKIYGTKDRCDNCSILNYWYAMQLRGDSPEYYKTGIFDKKLYQNDLYEKQLSSESRLFKKKNYRTLPEVSKLYYRYHYDDSVRKEGKKVVTIDISKIWIAAVRELQKVMQHFVAKCGLGIETNPSSNLMISGIQKYDEHPIVKLYNYELEKNFDKINECAQISVSINTDDKGIFSTSLENEYVLMACALESSKDENDIARYDKNRVYDWINKVRKFSFVQSFKKIEETPELIDKNNSENDPLLEYINELKELRNGRL